jgi:L-lysine 6-transaminase
MEIIEEDKLVEKAATTGEYLQTKLLTIADKYSIIRNVRGKGLIVAFDFPDKNTRDHFIKKGLEKNVMFLGCGNQSIRFRPALIMEKADLDLGLNVLEDVVKTL